MKPIKFTLILSATLLLFSNCKNNPKAEVVVVESGSVKSTPKAVAETNLEDYATASFTINGMACKMGCAKPIEKKLAKLDGVGSAVVDFENKLATVKFDAKKLSSYDFIKTVEAVGGKYTVENFTLAKPKL